MEKSILKRNGDKTEELSCFVTKKFNQIEFSYKIHYYLDNIVDENNGKISKTDLEKHFTEEQMERNTAALKNAYFAAQGSISPIEIIKFRKKHKIAASTLSYILGFSKNTISNIEKDGISSLATGRLIKNSIENKNLLRKYIKLCYKIDEKKKERLLQEIEKSS